MPIDFISGAYGPGRAASIKKNLSYLEESMADLTEARDMLGISKLLHSAAVVGTIPIDGNRGTGFRPPLQP